MNRSYIHRLLAEPYLPNNLDTSIGWKKLKRDHLSFGFILPSGPMPIVPTALNLIVPTALNLYSLKINDPIQSIRI